MAFGRVAIAAALLLPLALAGGRLLALRGHGRAVAIAAVLGVALPFPLIATAERSIDSGLAGVLVATEPMFIAALAPLVLPGTARERMTPGRTAGLVLGLVGVAALLGVDLRGEGAVLGAGLVLVASLSYAGAVLTIARGLDGVPALPVVAVSLAIATVLLAPVGLPGMETPSGSALAALVALGVACTAAAFLAFFRLIALAGPSRAALITYVAPGVAVALGALVRDEPVTAVTLAGGALVLGGSWLATRGPATPPAPAGPDAVPVPLAREPGG